MKKLNLILLLCLVASYCFAQIKSSKPVLKNVGKELLPPIVNLTEADEFNPQFNSTGTILYFNRAAYTYNMGGKTDMQDIYVCELDTDGVIYQVYNAGKSVNTKGANAVVGTAGTSLIYLNNAYEDLQTKPGLSFSVRKEDGNFSKPKSLGLNLPVKKGYSAMAISYDKQAIIVSMLEENHRGRKSKSNSSDLFIYLKDGEGTFGKPIPLEDLNGTGSEISPWLTPDGQVLFFASSGKKGSKGGFDIYYSKRMDSNDWLKWSKPVSLGDKVNTPGFDAYFMIDPFNRYGYFASDNGKKEAYSDIYRISLKELFSDIPNPGFNIDSSAINFFTKNTVLIHDTIYLRDTVEIIKYAKVDTTITIVQASEKLYAANDSLVKLSKIYFDFNDYNIRPDQVDSLNTALELALQDESIVLFIRSYTDVIGSNEYNLKLSKNRSLSIKQMLEAKGLPKGRIFAIGKGKDSKNLAPATDEQGRSRNRRADLEIRRGKIVAGQFVEGE